jgi:hypothetical protein
MIAKTYFIYKNHILSQMKVDLDGTEDTHKKKTVAVLVVKFLLVPCAKNLTK